MSVKDFFKRPVATLAPSGQKAAETRHAKSKYGGAIKKAAALMAGVAITLTMAGCDVVPREQIDTLKSEVSAVQVSAVTLEYDKNLLANIDEIHDSGRTMEASVEAGLAQTWKEAKSEMPASREDWQGEDWVISDHHEQREKEATKKETVMTLDVSLLGTPENPYLKTEIKTKYLPEFRDNLEKEIGLKEAAYKSPQMKAALPVLPKKNQGR